MPDKHWLERVEAAWGRDWKQVSGVLRESLSVVCKNPGVYLLFTATLLLLRYARHLAPLNGLEGWRLYVVANLETYLFLLASFCVLLVIYHSIISRIRDGVPRFPSGFFRRLGKALPFGFCFRLFFVWPGGLFWVGLTYAGNMVLGTTNNSWIFNITYYVSMIPALFFLCRYGFTLIGAAVGDTVTFRDVSVMSKGRLKPLLFTAFIWLVCLEIPALIVMLLYSTNNSLMFDLTWLFRITRPVVPVFFAVVATVWYEKLRLRHEAADEGESFTPV